jgi:hypothetical protein
MLWKYQSDLKSPVLWDPHRPLKGRWHSGQTYSFHFQDWILRKQETSVKQDNLLSAGNCVKSTQTGCNFWESYIYDNGLFALHTHSTYLLQIYGFSPGTLKDLECLEHSWLSFYFTLTHCRIPISLGKHQPSGPTTVPDLSRRGCFHYRRSCHERQPEIWCHCWTDSAQRRTHSALQTSRHSLIIILGF